jgi:diacylglycerol O-acyltransferase / wax synthase
MDGVEGETEAMDEEQIKWSTELSAFDYMMFRADSDARSRTSVGFIELLDRVPDWDRLRSEIDRASRVALRLRQRVVAPIVPLTAARWVIDPDFDLDFHLRRVRLPEPADRRALLDFAQRLHASPLDPTRPLWQLTLAEGLHDDVAACALVWNMSHAVTDGVGGMVLDRLTRTDTRDPDRGPMPPRPVPEEISPVDMTRDAARALPLRLTVGGVRRAGGAVGAVRRALRDPNRTVGEAVKLVDSLRKITGSNADPSPLLQRRGLGRRFEAYDLPLADLRAAGKAHGCSLNDAYVAAVCGALRRYHEALGTPVHTVAVAMPINIRPVDNAEGGGNQWAAATFAAPVGEPDPVRRMQDIRQLVLTARTDSAVNLGSIIAPVLAWLPQALTAGLGGGIDVQISNVPGSAVARYIGGAEVVGAVPIGPVPGVAMMVTMLSMNGRCYVGINYDTASITEHDLFTECLRAGFDEVVAAGRTEDPPVVPRRSTRTTATSWKEAPAKATPAKKTTPKKTTPKKTTPKKATSEKTAGKATTKETAARKVAARRSPR